MVSSVPNTKGLVRLLVHNPVTAWVAWLFRSFFNEMNPNIQLVLFGKRENKVWKESRDVIIKQSISAIILNSALKKT